MKEKEREAAKQLYKSKEGKTQLKDIQRKAKTFTPGEPLPEATNKNTNAAGLSPEQVGQKTRFRFLPTNFYNCTMYVFAGPTDKDDDCQGGVSRGD